MDSLKYRVVHGDVHVERTQVESRRLQERGIRERRRHHDGPQGIKVTLALVSMWSLGTQRETRMGMIRERSESGASSEYERQVFADDVRALGCHNARLPPDTLHQASETRADVGSPKSRCQCGDLAHAPEHDVAVQHGHARPYRSSADEWESLLHAKQLEPRAVCTGLNGRVELMRWLGANGEIEDALEDLVWEGFKPCWPLARITNVGRQCLGRGQSSVNNICLED